ncbi:hypothetical protein VPR01S_15_00330 [Vibrio proteolyticus NBRC 13287]|uniref:Glycoside hydrolase family 19 catalytic domain-containing protein n=2 Tax=Vibrio proteolyticus TaxID=671 RepID=U3A488_VIBPR|nr:hypothetical protein VPR01S_15_00330 [Vibrio proteolyticus NBRC 13287]
MVPWGKGLRPIQAMLDGRIVAYRIHPDYQTTTYKDQKLRYSNNFVLLEHEISDPDQKDEEIFKLYSLYMHLAPPSDIGANASLTTRYKLLDDGRNVRTFKFDSEPKKSKLEHKVSMSKGTVLEYLYAEEKATNTYAIGNEIYHMIKCRVIKLGESPSSAERKMKGKIVWFASGKKSKFNILEDPSVMVPEAVSEPEWMSESAARKRDGSVVALPLPMLPVDMDAGHIKVKAGDELGYMGLHEYSNDVAATKKEDNRIHIELFSVAKPPAFFLKMISPKNADKSPLITIDGSGSDGALKLSNPFFKKLLEEMGKEDQTDFSNFQPRDAKIYLENKRKHFEKVIVKHPSDWYTDISHNMYAQIHEIALSVMDEKYASSFVSHKEYQISPWRREFIQHHDIFSQHEKLRADKFSWLQDVQNHIQLPDDMNLWHYWPFLTLLVDGCGCILTRKSLNKIAVFASSKNIDRHYDSLISTMRDFEINTCLRASHFLAQIIHESGSFKYTEESGVSNSAYGGFKGRGLIQITLKDNYYKYGKYENTDFISTLNNKIKLANPPYSARSAGWYWSIQAKLNSHADNNDFIYLTYSINGGYNGYNDRLKWLVKSLEELYSKCPSNEIKSADYKFEESKAYNIRKASFGWGLWHDPGLSKKGCTKNKDKALFGYKRLLVLSGSSLSGNKKWYGYQKQKIIEFVKNRISELEG